ncbi:hypothetical protein VNO77_23026 [Canavalia gladiata]|uniref:Uncharacterized protein n=1 Tax=Canavalia gladiata TaxID=3824 RepID=A0AAN9QF08_CANGL
MKNTGKNDAAKDSGSKVYMHEHGSTRELANARGYDCLKDSYRVWSGVGLISVFRENWEDRLIFGTWSFPHKLFVAGSLLIVKGVIDAQARLGRILFN